MEYIKLQMGCLLVVLYIIFIYYKVQKRFQIHTHWSLYEILLCVGVVNLLLDAVTDYMVNHLDTVNAVLNRVLNGFFLVSLDALAFILFLYMLSVTGNLPVNRHKQILICTPFIINLCAVVLFLGELEYRHGARSNYSMGKSVYACYVMAAIYILSILVLVIKRWNYIQRDKRINIASCLAVMILVSVYQLFVPDSLITSIVSTMAILGAYMNQEDPAMKELSRYHEEMVMGFAALIESRDNSTGGHVKRTTQYVKLLAEELRDRGYYKDILTRDYMKNLLMAAPMHDVGKIAVPDAILQKPGKLTLEEFEQMKLHAAKGGEIIQQTFSRMGNEQYMKMAYQIARHHHEKWNGKGYPDGLKRKEIPLCARIMAIADVFDAVSEKRCYRDALPLEQCFAIIEEGSGQDFDPILTEVFLDVLDKVEKVREKGMTGNEISEM